MSHGFFNSFLVFNHDSLPFKDRESANDGMVQFVKLLRQCQKYGFVVLLVDERQDTSLMTIELSDDYRIQHWQEWAKRQGGKARDASRRFLSLKTKKPLFEPLSQEEKNTLVNNHSASLAGGVSKNILLASYYFKSLLLSFSAREKWRHPFIEIDILDLSDGTELEKKVQIINIFDDDSFVTHSKLLINHQKNNIRDSTDIWEHRLRIFPNLTLLDNQVGTSLKTWSGQPQILSKAREILDKLEIFSEKWKNGYYQSYKHEHLKKVGLNVSGESESVKSSDKLRKLREFRINGDKTYCDSHIKLSDGYRIYFYPDNEIRHIYVVYLGPHLATKKY